MKFRQHLIDITGRWGDDLFVCYDIAGVPPTNNALESRLGRLRRDQRRISGRQFNTATLLAEGPYLIWECGDSEAQVLARLRRVAANRVDYQRRYQKLRAEKKTTTIDLSFATPSAHSIQRIGSPMDRDSFTHARIGNLFGYGIKADQARVCHV